MDTRLIFDEVTQKFKADYPSVGTANPLVTETGTQTLTNKTLTSPVIGGTVSGGVTASGSLVAGANIQLAAAGTITFADRSMLLSPVNAELSFTSFGAVAAFSAVNYGVPGAATTSRYLQKKVTGLADTVATAVLTVTVPNANHAAAIRLMLMSSNGGTDAFESTRVASGMVVLARTTGVDCVATAIALHDVGIATIGSGATHTLAYAVTAMVGASSATQTFTITAAIDDSGNLGASQVVLIAELLNSEATGVTIA